MHHATPLSKEEAEERAFKLLELFCSLVRSPAGRVKGLPTASLSLPAAAAGWMERRSGEREGEWNGRKPLKPTEHDGDVVFSKERREELFETISGRRVMFI